MDERKHMGSTERRKFNANLVLPPLQPSLLKPYLYFERGESIYMVLYFPFLSSGGNPRAGPEETDAPASTSPRLILLTWGRSPTWPFPQCATESLCIYSRCVCVWGLRVRSARALALHGHLMCGRVKDACMLACLLKAVLAASQFTLRLPVSAHTCQRVRVCSWCFITLIFLSCPPPMGCRLSCFMYQLSTVLGKIVAKQQFKGIVWGKFAYLLSCKWPFLYFDFSMD